MAKRAHRDYPNDYPSVTTVLGVLRKPALEYWFKANTMKFINEASNKGKLIGKQIHECIQSYIETGVAKIDTEYGQEVTNALKSFILFRKENYGTCQPIKAEMALTSELYKFNGTIDCIGADNFIFDWKTAECKEKEKPVIYDEYKYQVAAYVKLYNETQNAGIDKAIIVSVAKDKVAYSIYEMNSEEINDCFNEVFLPALKIINFQRRKDKNYELFNGHVNGETTQRVVTEGVA